MNNSDISQNTKKDDVAGGVLQSGIQGEMEKPKDTLDLNVMVEKKQNLSDSVVFDDVKNQDKQTLSSLEKTMKENQKEKSNQSKEFSGIPQSNLNDSERVVLDLDKKTETQTEDILSNAGVVVMDDIPNETSNFATKTSDIKTPPPTPKPRIDMPIQDPDSNSVPISKENQTKIFEKKESIPTEKLESDFNEAFAGSSKEVLGVDHNINQEKNLLLKLLDKVKSKISLKKNDVKERIDTLRAEKEIVSHELEDIKELEETEQKISEKISLLEKMDEELDNLTNEANQELDQ